MKSLYRMLRVVPGILLLAACGGSGDSTLPPPIALPPGITVLSGSGVTDTIDAMLAQPLEIVVRDANGKPMSGAFVTVEGGRASGSRTVRVEVDGRYEDWWSYATDANGRVAVRLRLGQVTGAGHVAISVQGQSFQATAQYTILPGAPARLDAAPRDTAVFPGSAVGIRIAPTDRARHPVYGTPSYAVVDGPATVDLGNGRVTTTATLGPTRIVVRMGPAADTVRVSTAPPGSMVVAASNGMFAMNFDGTRSQLLTAVGGPPAWHPDGNRVVYASGSHVLVTQSLSGPAEVLIQGDTTRARQHSPQYSSDGSWVYFATVMEEQPYYVWRVRADGTGLQRITARNSFESQPSPSPDGTRIAYQVQYGAGAYIRVRELGTGTASGDLAWGDHPRWSPTAELIAFNEIDLEGRTHGIMVMRPDGTELRRVTPPGMRYARGVNWSPDGAWLIAPAWESQKAHLIRLSDGLMIELPYAEFVHAVGWRPGGLLP